LRKQAFRQKRKEEQAKRADGPRTEAGKGKQKKKVQKPLDDSDDGGADDFLHPWNNDFDDIPVHISHLGGMQPVLPQTNVPLGQQYVPPLPSSTNDGEPRAWAKAFFDIILSKDVKTKVEEVLQAQRMSNDAVNTLVNACRELSGHILNMQNQISQLGANPKFALNEYTEFTKALLSTSQQLEASRSQYAPFLPILPGLADRTGTLPGTLLNPVDLRPSMAHTGQSGPPNDQAYAPNAQPSTSVATTNVASRSVDDLVREINEMKRQLGNRAEI
jgi:hypothetical protein